MTASEPYQLPQRFAARRPEQHGRDRGDDRDGHQQ